MVAERTSGSGAGWGRQCRMYMDRKKMAIAERRVLRDGVKGGLFGIDILFTNGNVMKSDLAPSSTLPSGNSTATTTPRSSFSKSGRRQRSPTSLGRARSSRLACSRAPACSNALDSIITN